LLIEGLIISSFALGVRTSYIYVRGEFKYIIGILQKAINERLQHKFLGERILGTDFSLDIFVHRGLALTSAAKKRRCLNRWKANGATRGLNLFSRLQGLYNCPTVVNNVETLATVGPIINMGGRVCRHRQGQKYRDKTDLCCGHINKPGVYEIELGLPVQDFLFSDQFCGGIGGNKD